MDDDVRDGGESLTEFFLKLAGELVRLLERGGRTDGYGDEEHFALPGGKQTQVARGRAA